MGCRKLTYSESLPTLKVVSNNLKISVKCYAGDYRYGFQGQETDDEVKGEGNSYTAEFWQYDSRLGRRWNVDPVVKYHESPYATFANNPISFIDPSGADTSLTPGSRGLILDILDENSVNYNADFATSFQKLVDDKSTVYQFDQWSEPKETFNNKGEPATAFGEFAGLGKNELGQNLLSISYALKGSNQGNKLDALFEEFDHAIQFLDQRFAYVQVEEGGDWQVLGYDFYDEVDNKVSRAKYLDGFKEGSQYKVKLYGLNAKTVKSNFSKTYAIRNVRLNYGFDTEENVGAFDSFTDPTGMKSKFESGQRWGNLLIGGE